MRIGYRGASSTSGPVEYTAPSVRIHSQIRRRMKTFMLTSLTSLMLHHWYLHVTGCSIFSVIQIFHPEYRHLWEFHALPPIIFILMCSWLDHHKIWKWSHKVRTFIKHRTVECWMLTYHVATFVFTASVDWACHSLCFNKTLLSNSATRRCLYVHVSTYYNYYSSKNNVKLISAYLYPPTRATIPITSTYMYLPTIATMVVKVMWKWYQ